MNDQAERYNGIMQLIANEANAKPGELTALRAFVREVSQQDPAQVHGQRQSNKERAEDLVDAWSIQ